eukprot:s386_g47.t1
MRGRLRTAWVQGSIGGNGWGKESRAERAWMRGRLRTAWVEIGRENEPLGMSELGCADGCRRRGGAGAREWVEMGREKEPLGMSELGCADGCGRRECKGVGGNG